MHLANIHGGPITHYLIIKQIVLNRIIIIIIIITYAA